MNKNLNIKRTKFSQKEAKTLIEEYISTLDLNGWRYEFVSLEKSSISNSHWSAVFDTYSPEGGLVDGPVEFIIHARTGAIHSLDDCIEFGQDEETK